MKRKSISVLSPSRLTSSFWMSTLCAVSVFQLLGSQAQAALATPDPFPATPAGGFDGAYMGVNGGFLYETIKFSYQDAVGQNLTTSHKYGGIGGSFLGYLYEIGASRVLIGAETNVIVANTGFKVNFSPNSTDVYGQANVFRKYSVGATAILGKLFNAKTFLFLKAGMESIQYVFDFHYDNPLPASALPALAALQGTKKTVKPKIKGFTLGAGLDYLMTRQIAVGAEYNYSGLFLKYKNFVIPGTGGTESINLKRYEHKVMLRASFRFG